MYFLILLLTVLAGMTSTFSWQNVVSIVAMNDPDINSIEGRELEYIKLMEKVDTESLPIHQFSNDIKRLLAMLHSDKIMDGLDKMNSIQKLQQLYNRYLDKLRDYYYMTYVNSFSDSSREYTADAVTDLKYKLCAECEAAMSNGLESDMTQSWSYQGPLQELKDDLDSYSGRILRYLETKVATKSEKVATKYWFMEKIYQKIPFLSRHRKRVKWLAAQLILLTLNFLQNEIHRKSSYRAANKRLAEIPAFPML